MLDRNLAECVLSIWATPLIDMFASRVNKQLKRFVSWKNDPDAEAIDAFSMTWTYLYFYAFSPFSLIPRLLFKLQEEKGVFFFGSSCVAHTSMVPGGHGDVGRRPLYSIESTESFYSRNSERTPSGEQVNSDGLSSVRQTLQKLKYLQGLPTLSWPHGGQELKNSITCIYKSGCCTAVKEKLVVFKFP